MAEARGWRVTNQVHSEKYTGNGEFEPTVTVYYETTNGVKGHVDIPEARYSADSVAARLNELVGRLDEVHALGNG